MQSLRTGTQEPTLELTAMVAVASIIAACGGGSDGSYETTRPYDDNLTTVYGGSPALGGEFAEHETPDGDECIAVASGCIRPQEECGEDGTADVVADENGNVLDVICYGHDVLVEEVPIDQINTATAGNNTVLVLDGEDDGDDITGDVILEGNNAIVYGEGPDRSVIGGSLDIQKNNAIVRGVRIKGDVTVDKNNTHLIYCVIEGDLTILKNNTTIADCTVFGQVTIGMNNTVLVQNRFNGVDTVTASNGQCSGNQRFDDLDDDLVVTDDELGGAVECVSAL